MTGVQIVPDGDGGATVMRDGHPQSHVALDDPEFLVFEYIAHMAAVLDVLSPPPPGPLRITHVGGGGLTLARYVQATRPGSPQIVLEPDAALTEAVRAELPLPRQHRIRVRPQDGASGVARLADASADVLLLDAYDAGRVPADLTTLEFWSDCARVLVPGGTLIANLADEPGLRFAWRMAATSAACGLDSVALIATHDVLKGRRFGNTVLVAIRPLITSTEAEARGLVSELRRRVARSPFPTGVVAEGDLAAAVRRAKPSSLQDPATSPQPPDPGAWRVR